MRREMTVVISVIVFLLVCSHPNAGWGKDVHKEFDGVKSVELSSVSGDCIIKTHSSDKVVIDLFYDIEPEGAFEYKIREAGKSLIIKEKWRGHSSRGEVVWTLTVPAKTEVEFSTASGDLAASGLSESFKARTASGDIKIKDMNGDIGISVASGDIEIDNAHGEIDISTASGDIEVENSGGEIDLSTASGDITAVNVSDRIELSTASGEIEVSDSRGSFALSCASGDVEAKDIEIEDASKFSTASGDVEVILAKTSEYDLELSSASGDVVLDYNGKPVKGYFEMEARKRRGRIKCPFDFEGEEEFESNGHTYVRKFFHKDGKSPEIYMSTASGTVALKK